MSTIVQIPGGRVAEEAPRLLPGAMPDRERRIISKLGIPWSVPGLVHRLAIDEFTETKGEQAVYDELCALAMKGWCVNLGSRSTSAKVVHAAQAHPETIEFPDENADIYARRMALPHRAYRCEGDTWMLTVEGLEALKQPIVDVPPLTPSELGRVIASEFARVDWNYDPRTATGETLQFAEYQLWLGLVVEECERIWGVRPPLPIAGGASGWSDAFEITILDQENQKTQAPALVDPWFMALSILALGDTDTGTTADNGSHIPTYTGYARKSVAASLMSAASAGSSTNSGGAIQFAACTGGSSTIVSAGNTSAATVGILRKWLDVASTAVSTTATPAQFATSAYTTTAD